MVNHAHILGVVQIRAALALDNRKILARPLFLDQIVLPAAGLCACAMVGIAPGQVLRDQAAARIGNAHCAVDKGLNFEFLRRFRADFCNFLQAEFPGKHNAFSAKIRPEICCRMVENTGLGADVQRYARRILLCQRNHAHIRNNQRIRASILKPLQICWKLLQVFVRGNNVDRDIALHAACMGISNGAPQRFVIKICSGGTHAEAFPSHIDCIRAVGNRKTHFIKITGRR